eukprot:1537896-Pleurochrysis_carterae.AAC.1
MACGAWSLNASLKVFSSQCASDRIGSICDPLCHTCVQFRHTCVQFRRVCVQFRPWRVPASSAAPVQSRHPRVCPDSSRTARMQASCRGFLERARLWDRSVAASKLQGVVRSKQRRRHRALSRALSHALPPSLPPAPRSLSFSLSLSLSLSLSPSPKCFPLPPPFAFLAPSSLIYSLFSLARFPDSLERLPDSLERFRFCTRSLLVRRPSL